MSPPTVYGNVIEYIEDRLYLASYTSAPTASTPFPPASIPDPYKQTAASAPPPGPIGRSPTKRQRNTVVNSSGLRPVYLCVDEALLYNAFHHDFGPLHIGHLYRFAISLHDILGDPKNENRVVVFWSRPDVKARANAACLLACYMVLVQNWPPHLALSPLSHCDPPLMPFRDAGYSQADFMLNVQDVVYGVWKAKEKGILNLREFALDEYEKYERVDMGDFNWVSPNFLAFASPQHELPPKGHSQPHIPTNVKEIRAAALPTPFKNVLEHFYNRDIGLVVRLNSKLYPAEYFDSLGITHVDMIFDDGTCPPLSLVRKFINMAHTCITKENRHIAVHCKAGLGRTGCLIGAYLIYRYGFTANEVIAYMRFMRPGMVVGPQQHWLHLNQGDFRQWFFEDSILAPALEKATTSSSLKTPTKSKRVPSTSTTPTRRSILGEVDANDHQTALLPAPTPGQPRKTSASRYPENPSPDRSRRRKSTQKIVVDEIELARALEAGITEEEYYIRLQKRVTTARGSPKRSVSFTTTTTTVEVGAQTEEKLQKARSSPRRPAGVRKVSAGTSGGR